MLPGAIKTPDLWLVPPQPDAHLHRIDPEVERVLNPNQAIGHCLPEAQFACLKSLEAGTAVFAPKGPTHVDANGFLVPTNEFHVIGAVDIYLESVLGENADTIRQTTVKRDISAGDFWVEFTNLSPDEINAIEELDIFQGLRQEPLIVTDPDTDIRIIAIRVDGSFTMSVPQGTSIDKTHPLAPHLRVTKLRDPNDPKRILVIVDKTLTEKQLQSITTREPDFWDNYGGTIAGVGGVLVALGLAKLLLTPRRSENHQQYRPRLTGRPSQSSTRQPVEKPLTREELEQAYGELMSGQPPPLSQKGKAQLLAFIKKHTQEHAASRPTELTPLEPTQKRLAQLEKGARALLDQVLAEIDDPELSARFRQPPPVDPLKRLAAALEALAQESIEQPPTADKPSSG